MGEKVHQDEPCILIYNDENLNATDIKLKVFFPATAYRSALHALHCIQPIQSLYLHKA